MLSRKPSAMPGAMALEVLQIEPQIFAYCGWRNFSIGVWVGQATLDAVENLLRMSEELESRFATGRSSVIFVTDKVPAPTPEAREAFTRVYTLKDPLISTERVWHGNYRENMIEIAAT